MRWSAGINVVQRQKTCEACNGGGYWLLTSPTGRKVDVSCPYCDGATTVAQAEAMPAYRMDTNGAYEEEKEAAEEALRRALEFNRAVPPPAMLVPTLHLVGWYRAWRNLRGELEDVLSAEEHAEERVGEGVMK